MKKRILAAVLASFMALGLAACSEETREFELTSEISAEKQAEADKVLDEFMACFEAGDAAAAFPLLSEEFQATEEELAEFFSEIKGLIENPFVKFDSYYMDDLETLDAMVKIKKSDSDENYIELTPASEEMYLALYASEGEKISYMLSVLLAHNGEEFEIVWINPGDFKYNGEDAPAIYEKTKALADSGSTIPAYISSCMLGLVLRPAGFYRYPNDLEMEDLGFKLYSEMTENYELPLALEDVPGAAVYEIGIAKDDEHGIIPLILFKTDVPTSDEAAVTAAAEKVAAALDKLSPGLYDSYEYVRMNATNDDLGEDTTSVNTKSILLKI